MPVMLQERMLLQLSKQQPNSISIKKEGRVSALPSVREDNMNDKGGITHRGGKGTEKIELVKVICPSCKSTKDVKKGVRVACDKCNRDMEEVKIDDGKKA